MNLKAKINKINFKKNIIFDLFSYIPNKRKVTLFLLLFLMLCNGLSELFNIRMFQEFLLVISNKNNLENNFLLNNLLNEFNINSEKNLLLFTGFFYIFSLIISTFLKTYIIYLTAKISSLIAKDFSYLAIKNYLYQNYEYHITENSNKIISIINVQVEYAKSYVLNLIEFIFQAITISFLIVFLIRFNFNLAFTFSSLILITYFTISLVLDKRIKNNGKIISKSIKAKNKSLLESIGHIKELILTQNQNLYLSRFMKFETKFRLKNAENIFLPRLPRYFVESIALTIFISISLANALNNNSFLTNFIAILGTFALASQKLLSSVQASFANWSSMLGSNESLKNVLELLKLDKKEYENKYSNDKKRSIFNFKNSITFSSVSYKYNQNSFYSIKDINLTIVKGEKIGIIGKTGSGKTTFLNLLISLLTPTSGKIIIDKKDLRSKNNIYKYRSLVSYVPQNIYLSDNTIKNNIAFGIQENQIDQNKLEKVIKISQLKNWIDSLPLKENTYVGENGLSISGGQRQRLAIARSIYSKSQILILDEATSAMDQKTEEIILNSLDKIDKNITLIMVAHRLNTLVNCDRVIELENGLIKDIYNKNEFLKKLIN